MNSKRKNNNQMSHQTKSTDMLVSEASFNLIISHLKGNIHENANITRYLKLSLQKLLANLKSEESAHVNELENLLVVANHVTTSLSSLLMDLTSPRLENQTLRQGLSDFVDLYKSGFPNFRDIKVLMDVDESINQFPIVAEALFIIIKESITNALFHGKATKIEISLVCSKNKTNLVVSDNGSGFDIDEKLTGSGINVMKSITDSLNGNFILESKRNSTTIIRVSIPLL